MKRSSLLDLRRRWRLRSAGSAADWGIYDFSPSDERDAVSLAIGLQSLTELLAEPCLFLLGRPGAGKTAEFHRHFNSGSRPDETLLTFEARHLDGAGADSIFSGEEWRDALSGKQPIRLVLDGVDEALLGRGNFMNGLQRQLALAKAAAEKRSLRFSIVLTCRLSEWSDETGGEIAELWGLSAEDYTYELAPLSFPAALTLAEAQGVTNGRAFAKAVLAADMEAYACWPRTLIWLAKEYARGGAISATLTELHERRCSWQFEDPDRIERLHHNWTPEEMRRMGEAVETLAAAAIATGTQRFVLGRHAGERELDVSELASVLSAGTPAGAAAAQQDFMGALKFGSLFERSGDAWLFQEQSDAEFLAARRLAQMPVEQMAEFFGTETARGWEVFPQLHATAAMAAVHSPEFRQWLLDHDPLVLLRTDFARLKQDDKEAAVTAFLALIEAGKGPDAHEVPSHLQTLAHPNLAAQLRPWLHDRTRNVAAREMALRMAAACADEKLRGELGDDIWQLATGPEAELLSHLPRAIAAIGVSWPKERLMAMATESALAGRDWSSKGAALYALFDRSRVGLAESEQTKLSEIVPHLGINPTGDVSTYDDFVISCHEFLRTDDPAEVCAALEALKQWTAPLDHGGSIYKLAIAALRAATSFLHDERVLAALVDWWYWAVYRHNCQVPGHSRRCSLADIGLDVAERRQTLLAAILQHPLAEKLGNFQISDLPCEIEDYPWLLARLPSAEAVEEKILARLIAARIFDQSLREANLPALRIAYSASAALREILPPAPDGDIHTALIRLAEEQKRRWAEDSAKRAERRKSPPKYDAVKALADNLDGCRRGEEQCWPWLLYAIEHLESEGGRGELWRVGDPRELPGWSSIPAEDLAAVGRAARNYLLHHPPTLPARNQSHLGIEATKHALTLLGDGLLADSELRGAFRPEWVDVILRSLYPTHPPLPQLLGRLMRINEQATTERIREQLAFDWSENRFLLADYLDPVWSAPVQALFEEVLSHSPIQPESYRSGITFISRHDRDSAAALALRRCEEFADVPPSISRRVAIGAALLAFPEHWQRVWPLVVADAEEGIRCIASVAGAFEHLGWKEFLFGGRQQHADFIASLYGWLLKHLPPAPLGRTSYTPDGIDHCRDIQRECHKALVELGRADLLRRAFDFAGIADRPWTARVARETERNALAQQWQPWPLAHFAQWLGTEGGVRLTDNDALLRAVEASLRRFGNAWANGQMPPIRLWDIEKIQPRREKALSDELKAHLAHDLPLHALPKGTRFFINREPEFFTGEATDIHIGAAFADGTVGAVVVEVKLCDHPDVRDAMRTQLAERYLLEKGVTHGVYFVGWFTCETSPKKKRPFQNQRPVDARRYLEEQAAKLSKGGLRVRTILSEFPLPKSMSCKSKRAKPNRAA